MAVSVFVISTTGSGTTALLWSVIRPDIEAFSVCADTYCGNGPSKKPTTTDNQTKKPVTRRRAFFFMVTPLSKNPAQVRDLPHSPPPFSKPTHRGTTHISSPMP